MTLIGKYKRFPFQERKYFKEKILKILEKEVVEEYKTKYFREMARFKFSETTKKVVWERHIFIEQQLRS